MQFGSVILMLLSVKRGAAYIVVEAILICNEKEAYRMEHVIYVNVVSYSGKGAPELSG